MEDLLTKFGWKKTAAVLIGVSIIGIGYVMLSFSNLDQPKTNKAITGSVATSSSKNFEITTSPSQKTVPAVTAKTYITPYYQISYPQDYNAQLFQPPDGTLHSLLLISSQNNSKIEITVYDSATNSLDSLSRVFTTLGYANSPLTIGALTGRSYEGKIKGMGLYEYIALLTKGDKIIKLQLMQQAGPSKNINQTFLSILNSLQ